MKFLPWQERFVFQYFLEDLVVGNHGSARSLIGVNDPAVQSNFIDSVVSFHKVRLEFELIFDSRRQTGGEG